jgi:phenylacetate-CoA ligase
MIIGKALYDFSPMWAQMVAVNLASAFTYRQKYGRAFHEDLAQLEANEKKSYDQLLHEQQQAVASLLRYAVERVPYYRDHQFPPDSLKDWPILDKQSVASAPDRFLSDEYRLRRLQTLQTSGTTGTPLTVYYSERCYQREMAFRWRHKAWGGVPFLSRGAYLSGHPVVPADQTHPPFWRVDYFERRLLCSSYHFTPKNMPHYAAALSEFAPDFIHGYPSSLYVLAQFITESGWSALRPRAVFTASETLLDFQRALIERAFAAPVFNWYGTSEMTCNIVECAYGNLHCRTDYGLLELLGDGTMVATGLVNRAMPLIRYRAGDVGSALSGKCECGCAFPLMERIEGRVENYIVTPDGRYIGRLDHIFKGVEHVREAQLVQKKLDELVLRIVRANGFSPRDERMLLGNAYERLGRSLSVRCEYVETIERSAGGKFAFVVSELSPEQREIHPTSTLSGVR